MILMRAKTLRRPLDRLGNESWDFFGPWNNTSEERAVWAQKNWDFASQQNHKEQAPYKKNRFIGNFMQMSREWWFQGQNTHRYVNSWSGGSLC